MLNRLCFQTINCVSASPRARHQEQDRCLCAPHCVPDSLSCSGCSQIPEYDVRCSNNPEVLAIVLETDWRYYLELKLLSPVLIQSSILRHQMNNTKLERHRRLLRWWACPGLESGLGSQFTLCSQHMRAINPQSDHYILITTSANDYQLCQDAEREAGDSKETIFEQKGWKLSSKLEDKQFTARWSKKYHETHS